MGRATLTAIRENGATSGVGVLATYEYDQLGRRDRLVLGNGAVTDYQYDSASRLWKLTHDPAGTGHDNIVTLTYNPAGQIVGRSATNNSYAWTGHGSGTTDYATDGLNRLPSQTTGGATTSFSHDPRSNRTSDGTRTYVFDSENKTRGTATAPWHYDPVDRLSGVSTSPGTPPAIAYESYVDNLVAERTPGSSSVQRRHVFGPGVDEPLVWYEGSGTADRRFLQADERGSIVAVSNGSGAVQNVNRYDEYGRTQVSNPNWQSRFAYTGQRYFGGFGLYHYKSRMYDPKAGRFLQPDPIGYGGGMNMYAYVGGDPVNFTDPNGTCSGTLWGRFRHNEDWSEHELLDTWWVWDTACYFGGSSGPDLGSGGSETQKQEVECKLGNGAINVSFDGTTLNITTKINLVGPGAATSGAYIAGIAEAWTKSFGHINSIANISAGLGGLTAHISSERYPPPDEHGDHGPRAELGGNNIWLGNLGNMPDWQKPFAIKHVGPHEFGHTFRIDNMPQVGKWAKSIMANSANNVSPTDLEAVVEACRAAG